MEILFLDSYYGKIYGVINKNYKVCNITLFKIKKHFQNKKHGTRLLQYYIQLCKDSNVKHIELDDMTDNYRKNNNIYIKVGFVYINDDGPEMRLNLI